MPMKKIFYSSRSRTGRDMNQMKPMPHTLQFKTHRPVRLVVLISPHDLNRRPDSQNLLKSRLLANIPQVPNLIRWDNPLQKRRGEPIMRIGNDRNPESCSHFSGSSQRSESVVLSPENVGPTIPPHQQKER